MDDEWQVDALRLIEQTSRSRLQLWILISSLALMFIEGYDLQVMAFAAPAIIRDWHISKQLFGPVLSASLVGYLAGALIVSIGGDYFGRKVTIVAAAFVLGIFTLATAFATSLSALLALRFFAGLGLGGMIPALIALNTEYAPAARRGTRVSLLYIGYGIGATVCGFLPWLKWPVLFEIGGVLALVFGLLAVVMLPESVRFLLARKAAPSKIKAILKRLNPDLALDANVRFVSPGENYSGVPVRLLFSEGRAGMTVLLWAAFTSSLITHYFLISWLPTLLSDGGLPMHDAQIAGGLFNSGGLAGAMVVGIVIDRKGTRGLAVTFLLAAPLIIAIGFSRFSLATLMVVVFLAGSVLIGGQAGLSAFSGLLYPTSTRSTGVGWALGVGRLGAIAGPVIGGFVLSAGITMQWLFTLASLPAIACATALFFMRNRGPVA